MLMDFKAAAVGGLVLQLFDLFVAEFFHMPTLQADDMVVVAALVELEHRFAAFKVMPHQQAGLLELRQHAIHSRQPDIVASIDHYLIDVFGREMTFVAFFKQLKDFQAW